MIREHSDDQIRERARQIDAGRRAGLSDEQLISLVGARAKWHLYGAVPPELITAALRTAASCEAAMVWDGVFTTALRRQLRNLSDPGPNVHP